jgi:hypothetical protein
LEGLSSGAVGQMAVAIEVFEVVPSLFMVEVRKAAGDTLEYHKVCLLVNITAIGRWLCWFVKGRTACFENRVSYSADVISCCLRGIFCSFTKAFVHN